MYLTRLHPRPATKEELAYVHTKEYIAQVESTEGKSAWLDHDTAACPKSWTAALLAAGGVIACVDHVLDEEYSHGAFAFVRPPGHHAERDRAMGFCIFNNIAIAAEHAIKKRGVKKIAILDFDVHHGNGTQHHFYDREDVFFASTHRHPFYPGTGHESEKGVKAGLGFTMNVELNAGMGDKDFKSAWGGIFPEVEKFAPELILVSAGFDAHELDPMGGLNVTTDGYRWLAAELVKLAKKCCKGRLVMVLEGGYSLSALKSCVRATLEEMF
jgi:acetoin utilization deacetylase AcuC-like enzyme